MGTCIRQWACQPLLELDARSAVRRCPVAGWQRYPLNGYFLLSVANFSIRLRIGMLRTTLECLEFGMT